MNWIFESERLGFRRLHEGDLAHVKVFLQDIDVMYAWGHIFTDEEAVEWIQKNIKRYTEDGYSYFAAIEKDSGAFAGVIGPLKEEIEGVSYTEIAYILNKSCWGKGYAVEGAQAAVDYAFRELGCDAIIAQIKPDNLTSIKVAQRLGMVETGSFIKHYRGEDLLHLILTVTKEQWAKTR